MSSSSSAQSFLPIAIVGGGPAGLTLARVLQLHDVACTVYENEAAATARSQGGSLDLHAENGLWALQQCRLVEQFNQLSRPEGDCMRIMDETGQLLHSEEPPKVDEAGQADGDVGRRARSRPEIDRLALRNLLLHSLHPDTVQWGHALASLEPLPPAAADGLWRWQLTFKNGQTARAAVVIGADGAWSRVRPLLSSASPRYAGVSYLDCTLPQLAARFPRLAEMVGPGTTFVLGEQKAIIAQMNGNDVLRSYACLKVDEGWADDETDGGGAFLASPSREALDTFIARYFRGWHEPALQLLRQADVQSLVVRRMFTLPFDHRFSHSEQTRLLTAVGDAAHVMGPNGEGVNLAMMDAAQLALAIAQQLSPQQQQQSSSSPQQLAELLAAAVLDSERAMFDRFSSFADDPINFDFFLSEGAAVKFAALFKKMSNPGQPEEVEAVSSSAHDLKV